MTVAPDKCIASVYHASGPVYQCQREGYEVRSTRHGKRLLLCQQHAKKWDKNNGMYITSKSSASREMWEK